MALTAKDVLEFLEPFVKRYGKSKLDPEKFVQEFIEYKRGQYNSIHMAVSGLNDLFTQVFPRHDIVKVTDDMRQKNLIGKMPTSFRSRSGKNIYGFKIWNIDPNRPRVSSATANTVDNLIAQVLGGQTKSSRESLIDMGIPAGKLDGLSSNQLDKLLELAKNESPTNEVEAETETQTPKKRTQKAKPAIL